MGGQDWDVTTFTGTYNDNRNKFETLANNGVMPWWGDAPAAEEFAQAVFDALGTPNNITISGVPVVLGPFFGFDEVGFVLNYRYQTSTNSIVLFNGPASNLALSRAWAQASPVPGPLPALGAAACFGFSRKLRKRIKNSANIASNSYSL